MLNTVTETDAPSRDETIQDINWACIEINTAARTLRKIADQAIDDLDSEGQDFAHSAELLAREIGRRVLRVQNFLDRNSFESRLAHPNEPATKAIVDILRDRIEGWKAFTEAPDEYAEPEGHEAAENALHKGDNEADEATVRLGGKSLDACLAKLIIDVGPGINREANAGAIEAETAAAALERFGLKELYDEYFPAKEAAA